MACCLQRHIQNPVEHPWYSKAVNIFLKKLHLRCLTSFWRQTSVMETIISNVTALQIWLTHRRLPISFSNTFLWLLRNIEKKGLPFDNGIVRCKNSIVLKDLAKIADFFLLGILIKHLLAAKFFYFLYAQRFSWPLVILDILFKNNSYLLGERFFCNQQSSYHRPR